MQQSLSYNGIKIKPAIDTPKKTSGYWHCYYLFHPPGLTDWLLLNFVTPLINYLQSEKVLLSFFFIRYFEDGKHLRLRFKTFDKSVDTIEESIKYYLTNSLILLENSYGVIPNKEAMFRLVQKDYEPEFKRYGGMVGINLAEELFCASSKCVLNALTDNPSWSNENAISVALAMHYIMINYLIEASQRLHFYEFVSICWASRSFDYLAHSKIAQNDLNWQTLKQMYDRSFLNNKSAIKELIKGINENLKTGKKLEYYWLNNWRTFVKKHAINILRSIEDKTISLDTSKYPQNPYFPLFESFMHMTNNRLGISNHDESYIGYILFQVAKELS